MGIGECSKFFRAFFSSFSNGVLQFFASAFFLLNSGSQWGSAGVTCFFRAVFSPFFNGVLHFFVCAFFLPKSRSPRDLWTRHAPFFVPFLCRRMGIHVFDFVFD